MTSVIFNSIVAFKLQGSDVCRQVCREHYRGNERYHGFPLLPEVVEVVM